MCKHNSLETIYLDSLRGIGPKRVEILSKLHLRTVADLLYLKPRMYQDRSHITPIVEAIIGETTTLRGKIKSVQTKKGRNWKKRLEVIIDDGTARITGVWFNQAYLKEQFKRGETALFTGKIKHHNTTLQITSPAFEIEDDSPILNTGRIVPIYPLTEGVGQTLLRSLAYQALQKYYNVIENILGPDMYQPGGFTSRKSALKALHFPTTIEEAENARRYLAYEEFFLFQVAIYRKRLRLSHRCRGRVFKLSKEIDQRIRTLFPFTFTDAQNKALAEITADMRSEKPMNRLIQGDVGCGKTAVALYTMLMAVANKTQACIMAPTEILARQHEKTITSLLKNTSVRTISLVGSLSPKKKQEAYEIIAKGNADIIIGTHALVQEGLYFNDLGIAIIDEQHKFGVAQRAALLKKGRNAELLLMSATPIPRTMAMTIYGDLDISIIDALPPGRKPVRTHRISKQARAKAFEFIRSKLQEGQQVYCVYPLVEESEKLDLKSATEMAEHFSTVVFPEYTVALLHGKLDGAQKNRIMHSFSQGEINILVSTVVIEVGVNVPNANIMVIEEAQRFGLAQIHQLRGRIGRGDQEAHCLLFAGEGSQVTRQRLEVLVSTNDGFKISEADLQIRGPGEFMGTRQHGIPQFSYGDILDDFALMEEARHHAHSLLQNDPTLQSHPLIKKASNRFKDALVEF